MEIDPLSTVINNYLGEAYMMAGRYDDAYHMAEKQLEINPKMRVAIEMKGWATGMKGDWEKAVELFKEVHQLANHPLKNLGPLGHAYGRLGQKEKAMEVIDKLEQRQQQEPDMVLDGDKLMVWWSLQDKEKTIHHLRNCIDKGLYSMYYYVEYPMMNGMKGLPEIRELLEKNISLEK